MTRLTTAAITIASITAVLATAVNLSAIASSFDTTPSSSKADAIVNEYRSEGNTGFDIMMRYGIVADSTDEFRQYLAENLKTTDILELQGTDVVTQSPITGKYYMSVDMLKKLAVRDEENMKVVKEVVSENVEDGMTEEEALSSIAWYYASTYNYEKSLAPDTADSTLVATAQGMHYMLENGSAICASYSKAFLATAEEIPFNRDTHLVDFETKNPVYVDVKLEMAQGYHQWNRVYSLDGNNYLYDLTLMRSEGAKGGDFCRMSNEAYESSDTIKAFYEGHGDITLFG